MKKIILFFLLLFLTISCDKEEFYVDRFIELLSYDVIQTEKISYSHVYYKTLPYERVFWTSPDSIMFENEKICIVCCSTYSNELGNGQQLVSLPNNYNIKEWMIIGYINDLIRDTIYIK